MQIKLNEIGRSMIEMLGVLAVTGVLSVGGIMGYRFAMDKYRANDIIYEVNMRGQDIWNHYQGIELPESIDEWNDTTTTGYPIGIETAPADNLFSINVDNVSPRVCKLVLSGQYKSVYAMVIDREAGIIYDGNLEICGTNDSENKTMIFSFDTLSGFGEGHGLCIADSDCGEGCFYCGENHLCQTTCIGSKSVCSTSKQACVECETNEHCPEGKVCNDIENICETVDVKKCEEGYFRSKNGICIECSYAGNIIINPEETFGEDEVTGIQSCNACSGVNQPRIVEGDTTNTYCSKTCTTGISWPSTTKGCIPCDDDTPPASINGEDQDSVDQCLACPDHYVWKYQSTVSYICSKIFDCSEGTFMGLPSWQGSMDKKCLSCSLNKAAYLPIENATVTAGAERMCNNCPLTAPRRVVGQFCYPTCIQPDESESIIVCKKNPEDENCKRKWQGSGPDTAQCRSCSSTESAYVGTDTNSIYYQMCINCGRKVNSDGYCYLDKACKIGQFKGKDGACHECTKNRRVSIENEEISKCTANCMKDETGQFSLTGTITGRFADNGYCYKDCDNGFNGENGSCFSCSTQAAYGTGFALADGKSEKLKKECTDCAAPNERILTGSFCSLKNCPNGFHAGYGKCISCSAPGCGGDGITCWGGIVSSECIACGNRVVIDNRCVLIDPGSSGICNNVGNTLPDYLSNDLKNKANTYILKYETDIKNPNFSGKKFRDVNGFCQSCDKTSQIEVGKTENGKAQCKSCGNRRFATNGQCIYGLCSESGTFLRASDGACIACGTGGKKVEILISAASQNLCASCTGHRVMTTGTRDLDNLQAYCIESCTDFEFSDVNANCYDEDSTIETIEIGSDEKSISDCNKISNRTVITDEESGKTYCQLQ